jgi:hypothetical protein
MTQAIMSPFGLPALQNTVNWEAKEALVMKHFSPFRT